MKTPSRQRIPVPGAAQRAFYCFCRHLVVGPMMAYVRVRHFDVPDAALLRQGLLLASNHQSFLDPVLVGMGLPEPICYLARRDLFRVPGLGLLMRALGAYPVSRGSADAQAVRAVLELLRSKQSVLVFPEGTRTPDGELGPFRHGAAALAMRCQVPILPVCIEGAFRCWPRSQRLPRPGRVAVAFGAPLEPVGPDAADLTERLRARIVALQTALRRYLGCSPGQVPGAYGTGLAESR